MKNAIILGTLLFCAHSVRADVKPEPIKASHVFKLTPPTIKRLTPKGAKILQTVSFPIGLNRSDILVHLYADSEKDAYSGHLELFTSNNGHVKRIQSFKFKRPNTLDSSRANIAEDFFLGAPHWLNIQKEQPIIPMFVPDYRSFGSEITLFVFNRGITQPPVQQSLYCYNAERATEAVDFDAFDKSGNTRLCHRFLYRDPDHNYDHLNDNYFHWNGSSFIESK